MNIAPIFANFKSQYTQQTKNNFNNSTAVIKPNNLNYLAQDTVTFSGRASIGNTFRSLTQTAYEKSIPELTALGLNFLDTTTVIAAKFSDRGVSLPDRKLAEKVLVKKSDTFISKLLRSGEVHDKVRTTMYVENPYDFKLIRDIINEYKLRDYEICPPPNVHNGRRSSKPDFDIRLPGVTEQDTKVLGPELQSCIGEPLKTGYEDIQMRFVDVSRKKNRQQPIELIILYGDNYAKAKEAESYYSYDIRRALGKLLYVSKIENPGVATPAATIQDNIKTISQMLVNNISRPLFHNAKKKDFKPSNITLSTSLSRTNCRDLDKLIKNIRRMTIEHYNSEFNRIQSKEHISEIEKMIKASSDYKERADKTIYIDDIYNMRKQLKKDLITKRQDDLKIISEVRNRLSETIDKYGEKS